MLRELKTDKGRLTLDQQAWGAPGSAMQASRGTYGGPPICSLDVFNGNWKLFAS